MRTILLALLTVLVLAPQAADAARRDERGGTAVSRTNTAASPATRASTRATPRTTTRAAATRTPARTTARAAATRTVTRAAPRTVTRTAARPTSRTAARPARTQAVTRQAPVRRGDVRTQRSSVVVRGASAATISRGSGIAGWQAGLPAMTMTQRDCPVGTFATLARGHDDIVRCMPL
ncbi:hypothetical protein [Falsiroseomonas sp. E2-1-a4]|uniref:hypothetical protein n=1 Tax=Falsiroseomonas sp. E2-1-a4 TaxID=3239299 RepID=UPI003F2B589B